MKRVAILGLGDIAQVHLPILKSMRGVKLVAVCDVNERKKEGIPFYTDAQKLMSEVQPDVVHICLPHYLHYPMSCLAAKAQVNVFCEKPLAMNVPEAEQFVRLAEENPDLRFGLCLQNRYNNSSETLLRIIQSGTQGRVTGIKGLVPWQRSREYYTASPWRGSMELAGGGVMINQSVHTLDLMQLFGGKMRSLRGSISRLLDYGIEVEDTANAQIQFENGATGLFMATVANSKNDSVEIGVTLEQAEYLIADNALFKLEDGARTLVCQDDRLPGTKFYYGASHNKAISAFYASLEQQTEDYIHVCEGVNSMKMIDAIRTSAGSTILY